MRRMKSGKRIKRVKINAYDIAFPPGAGIARLVTDCNTIVHKLISAFDKAFPPGGKVSAIADG